MEFRCRRTGGVVGTIASFGAGFSERLDELRTKCSSVAERANKESGPMKADPFDTAEPKCTVGSEDT